MNGHKTCRRGVFSVSAPVNPYSSLWVTQHEISSWTWSHAAVRMKTHSIKNSWDALGRKEQNWSQTSFWIPRLYATESKSKLKWGQKSGQLHYIKVAVLGGVDRIIVEIIVIKGKLKLQKKQAFKPPSLLSLFPFLFWETQSWVARAGLAFVM